MTIENLNAELKSTIESRDLLLDKMKELKNQFVVKFESRLIEYVESWIEMKVKVNLESADLSDDDSKKKIAELKRELASFKETLFTMSKGIFYSEEWDRLAEKYASEKAYIQNAHGVDDFVLNTYFKFSLRIDEIFAKFGFTNKVVQNYHINNFRDQELVRPAREYEYKIGELKELNNRIPVIEKEIKEQKVLDEFNSI